MNLEEAMKRIQELERKVMELEARPSHIHYHQYQHPPGNYTMPANPGPYLPYNWPQVWCGGIGAGSGD